MRNPYPLIPPQPHAGLVCENVAFCKKSDEHLVRKQIEAQGGEEVVFTIEDHMEDDMMQMLARVNSYRLAVRPNSMLTLSDMRSSLPRSVRRHTLLVSSTLRIAVRRKTFLC